VDLSTLTVSDLGLGGALLALIAGLLAELRARGRAIVRCVSVVEQNTAALVDLREGVSDLRVAIGRLRRARTTEQVQVK
jgi:hypothetical protein